MQHGKGGQCYIMALLVIAFILLGFLSQGEAGQSIVVYNPAVNGPMGFMWIRC